MERPELLKRVLALLHSIGLTDIYAITHEMDEDGFEIATICGSGKMRYHVCITDDSDLDAIIEILGRVKVLEVGNK